MNLPVPPLPNPHSFYTEGFIQFPFPHIAMPPLLAFIYDTAYNALLNTLPII